MKIHGTAKGGAISKKDFGVAFGEAGGVDPVYESGIGSSGDATLTGGFSLSESVYKLGTGSVFFDGTDGCATANGVATVPAMTTAGTLSCWFNAASLTFNNNRILWSFGDTNGDEYLRTAFLNAGGAPNLLDVIAVVSDGATKWQVFTPDNSISGSDSYTTWHLFTLTQNATAPVFYIDGSVVTPDFKDETDKTVWVSDMSGLDNFTIACRNFDDLGNSAFSKTYIDDFGIWNRALSSSEVSDLWNGGSGNLCSTITDGLRVYYNMDSVDDDKLVNQAIPP